MQLFLDRLLIVRNHFKSGDYHIGFRKLVDCVLDTQQIDYYKKCIELTDWKESEKYEETTFLAKVDALLDDLSTAQFEIKVEKTALVKAVNIGKTYGSRHFQLRDVSITIEEGQIWGLVGENGNGKTTLLRILASDLKFDSGVVHYDFKGSDNYDLRTKLTYIPQRTPKWQGSLKDNLKFAAAHYGVKGEENELLVLMMIIRFGLWKFRDFYWNQLSSGYKMRFELARTFLRKPQLLLLDEPLANLDVLAQQLILEDLENLAKSLSNPLGIILSSQQLFEVEKVADEVLFLKNGSPTHLKESNALQTENGEDAIVAVRTYVELDSNCEKQRLIDVLSVLPAVEITYNGGMYVISFEGEDGIYALLDLISQHKLPLTYLRDISKSTRRLFV